MDIQIIGYIAAFCTSLSFLPQAVKVIKTRNTDSLSLSMYSVFSFGVLLWLIYGALLGDMPMIVANTITLLFALIILAMKVHHRVQKLRYQQQD
ncbi:SemiSWEET transporter [Alteromonas sp. ASW11-36]|uniref:SemiSWEET transporter n=1 Tax=Alteromonas arenosi TaxID=3055817 RepID=A0ABT7T211_9ALTE|nr:SemiSWEET transporter [Alteromonas sp. ASW11-36]MDM7861842.1 SemiSWEET transporter [Alteromonas sp. ASW11-36]